MHGTLQVIVAPENSKTIIASSRARITLFSRRARSHRRRPDDRRDQNWRLPVDSLSCSDSGQSTGYVEADQYQRHDATQTPIKRRQSGDIDVNVTAGESVDVKLAPFQNEPVRFTATRSCRS